MDETIDSTVNPDIIPPGTICGIDNIAYINQVSFTELGPGLNRGIVYTGQVRTFSLSAVTYLPLSVFVITPSSFSVVSAPVNWKSAS